MNVKAVANEINEARHVTALYKNKETEPFTITPSTKNRLTNS